MATSPICVTGSGLYGPSVAEIRWSDSPPTSKSVPHGMALSFSTTLVANENCEMTLRVRDCRMLVRQWDNPIAIGSCDVELTGGTRREATFRSPHIGKISMHVHVSIPMDQLNLVEQHRSFGDLRLGFEMEFVVLSSSSGGIEKSAGVFAEHTISKSNWESCLKESKYPIGGTIPVSVFLREHPSWNMAIERLDGSRRRLNSGDGLHALGEIDQLLKQFVRFPYNWRKTEDKRQDCWVEYLQQTSPDMGKHKIDAVAQLMSGLGGYLNKAWHHSEDIEVPTTHYEHELILLISHLMLTYLYRLGVNERPGDSK